MAALVGANIVMARLRNSNTITSSLSSHSLNYLDIEDDKEVGHRAREIIQNLINKDDDFCNIDREESGWARKRKLRKLKIGRVGRDRDRKRKENDKLH